MKNLNKLLICGVIIGFPFLSSCNKQSDNGNKIEAECDTVVENVRTLEYGVDVTDLYKKNDKVKQNQIITSLLREIGVADELVNQAMFIPDSVFDVTKMKAGNNYVVYYESDSTSNAKYMVYSHSQTDFIVFHLQDSLYVETFVKPIEYRRKVSETVINTSLWNAILDSNLNMSLALELSDIYAWTVDFFGLQKGDGFKVLYDEMYVDTVSIGIGDIHAAIFTHENKEIYAIYYKNDEVSGYWDLEGNSIKKAFLKAPLHFSRISSHFTYARKHPIYKTVRPHTGVDYAAPAGTPVVAIGDGVVTVKRYKGGGGKTVKIKHNSTYESAYLHLSKYGKGVEVGKRVEQGEVIGYVGSTGASTGAHLDFRIWKNGTPINPLTLDSPSAEPIPQKYIAEFDSIKALRLKQINK